MVWYLLLLKNSFKWQHIAGAGAGAKKLFRLHNIEIFFACNTFLRESSSPNTSYTDPEKLTLNML